MSKILITGGAGYIGSVVANYLSKKHHVYVVDNLSVGRKKNLNNKVNFFKLDFADSKLLKILKNFKIDTIMHFAASTSVPESVKHPKKFYNNNFKKTEKLILMINKSSIKNLLFASTCAVYGNPTNIPISETSKLSPINFYGKSKLMCEWLIEDILNKDKKYLIFRFFNVIGSQPNLEAGHVDFKSSQLLNALFLNIFNKNKFFFKVFGRNSSSSDGSCVRDYIDVNDLAIIFEKGMSYLKKNQSSIFNCGYNKGVTVLKMIKTFEKILNLKIKYKVTNSRKGDPQILVCDNKKIIQQLKWRPQFNNLKNSIKNSYEWFKKEFKK